MSRLTDLEAMYHETGNPLYVWVALARHDLCPDGAPLPAWVMGYLREVAQVLELMAIDWPPATAAKKVTAALGLTAHGRRNRFAEYQMDRRAEWAVWAHEQGRDLFRDQGGNAWPAKEINTWLAESTRANVTGSAARQWRKRGKRLKEALAKK
jgi:hypothetical protein